ncbi:MAG: triose-phosphate isomerase [SAR324 cluster bacterium]|nr:triose-phosphate isomerase [SAR324 cluster bacterium]
MARRTLIAGNWKMNLLPNAAAELVAEIKELLEIKENLEVIICPQMALVPLALDWVFDSAIQLGAQNCAENLGGAFTGETSPQLLKVLGCRYCLVGHSERRSLYGETNETAARKTQALLTMGITPIICVGETLDQRETGTHFTTIDAQVTAIFNEVDSTAWTRLVFAYEPIWAIGTGKTASPEQANEIHRFIRGRINELAGDIVANATSIIYGGSANATNAKELLGEPEIDGLLVGGASLKAKDFSEIIASF